MKTIKKKNILYIIAGVMASGCCIFMVAFPAISLNSAEKGVSLWASSVLPALLPFFICANFMSKVGVPRIVGKVFEKSFRKLFGAPGESAFVFLISITSGYPMGAKLIGDLGRSGQINESEAKRMLTFCSTSGPLFILGAVGVGLLGSATAGAVIACAHYAGAVLNGIFYRCITHNKPIPIYLGASGTLKSERRVITHQSLQNQSILDMLTDSIISSLKALGIICGYIVLFTILTDFIFTVNSHTAIDSPEKVAFMKGIFEMTVGCNAISQIQDMSLLFKSALCSFVISFGGLSILAQSMSMMSGLKISVWYYLKVKISHGLFSFLLVLWFGKPVFAMFAKSTAVTTMAGFGMETVLNSASIFYSLLFSTKMIIMLVIIFAAIFIIESQIRGKRNESSGSDN